MANRNHDDIYADILREAVGGNKSPSKVLLNAGLHYKRAKYYLPGMEQAGLISFGKSRGRARQTVVVTQSGEEWLKDYDMENMVGNDDKS